MRKNYLLVLLSLLFVGMTSCMSKEDKAEKLIKEEFSKTLYDFESYSPIETIVTEAKQSIYTDSAFFNLAQSLMAGYVLSYEYLEKGKEADEHMEIWGEPSRYSSSYSDRNYNKYKKDKEENYRKCLNTWFIVKGLEKNLKDTLQTIIPEKTIGWEVNHKFRCKTKGGHASIGNYRFVMDEKFKNILLYEDIDNEESKKLREIIEESLNEGLKLK